MATQVSIQELPIAPSFDPPFILGEERVVLRNISELWQYNGKHIQYYLLQDGEYVPVQISLAFPIIVADVLVSYLQRRLAIGEMQAIREFKAWLETIRGGEGDDRTHEKAEIR